MKIRQSKELVTRRLVLKSYNVEDMGRLVRILMNEQISRTFMIPDYPEEEQYRELAQKLVQFSRPEDERHLEYGIYLNGLLIGFINDCGFDDEEIEIGYVVHPDHQNRGYATEAVNAVIQELWTMGFQRITAGFFEDNPASRRVMEKCGMTLNGDSDYEEYRGIQHRCLYCEIRR